MIPPVEAVGVAVWGGVEDEVFGGVMWSASFEEWIEAEAEAGWTDVRGGWVKEVPAVAFVGEGGLLWEASKLLPYGSPPVKTVKGSSLLQVFKSIFVIGLQGSILRSSVMVLAWGYRTDTGFGAFSSQVVKDPSGWLARNCRPSWCQEIQVKASWYVIRKSADRFLKSQKVINPVSYPINNLLGSIGQSDKWTTDPGWLLWDSSMALFQFITYPDNWKESMLATWTFPLSVPM